jgi:hypothetical protein
MKKSLFVILLFILAQANAQKTTVIQDNNAQIRIVGDFTGVKVSSSIDLYLTQSTSNQVAVSAKDEESRAGIITEVVGGILIIKMEDNKGWFYWKGWSDVKAKAYVSIKDINALIGSGATNIHLVNKIASPKLKIKLSGASDLKGEVEAGALSINASGASNIELGGSVDDLSIEVSGASDAKLYNLITKGAIVHASGASTVNLNVTQLLKAEASGASSINYKGEPVIRENNSSGASSIKHKN